MFFNFYKKVFLLTLFTFNIFPSELHRFIFKQTESIGYNKKFNICNIDSKLKKNFDKYYLFIDKMINILIEDNKYYSEYLKEKIKVFDSAYLENKKNNKDRIPLTNKDFFKYFYEINFFENSYELSSKFSCLDQISLFAKYKKNFDEKKGLFGLINELFFNSLDFLCLYTGVSFISHNSFSFLKYINIKNNIPYNFLNNLKNISTSFLIFFIIRLYYSFINNKNIKNIENALIALIYLKNANLEINK